MVEYYSDFQINKINDNFEFIKEFYEIETENYHQDYIDYEIILTFDYIIEEIPSLNNIQITNLKQLYTFSNCILQKKETYYKKNVPFSKVIFVYRNYL